MRNYFKKDEVNNVLGIKCKNIVLVYHETVPKSTVV